MAAIAILQFPYGENFGGSPGGFDFSVAVRWMRRSHGFPMTF
jgi:hypothetical protein